jgi:hypothetical protein
MKYAITILLCVAIAGCSIPRSAMERGPVPGQIVRPTESVLILGIRDGQEQGQTPAVGSGQGMTAALRKVLVAHAIPLSMSQSTDLATGFNEAQQGGMAYVMQCVITLWQDNATAWSGSGDKLNISIEVYDAKTRRLVAAATHKRVATGFTFVSGSPDRFMDESAEGALSRVYGWTPR